MPTALHWLTPGFVLVAALAVGICVHELLHLVPLRLVDATCTVTVCPTDDASPADAPLADTSPADASPTDDGPTTVWATLQNALTSGLVRVEVTRLPPTAPDWVVRVAALLPLVLALPLLLVVAGVLPDPVASGDHAATAALVAATACGLPSPADWAVVWHGSRHYRHR